MFVMRRWGPKVKEASFKLEHRLYLSEQTDGSEPNKLVMWTADVCKVRAAPHSGVQPAMPACRFVLRLSHH